MKEVVTGQKAADYFRYMNKGMFMSVNCTNVTECLPHTFPSRKLKGCIVTVFLNL